MPRKAVPFLGTPGHCDTTACSGSTSIDTTSIQVGNAGQLPTVLKGIFRSSNFSLPIGSMYGIFTYIWLICMVNVGKYTIHGWYGICHLANLSYLLGHLFFSIPFCTCLKLQGASEYLHKRQNSSQPISWNRSNSINLVCKVCRQKHSYWSL